jgi:Kef-type K+ transport system membrane component KefB
MITAFFSPNVLASTEGASGRILLDILIILVAAKLAAEVADRLKIPTVVGEIMAGIAIGPFALKLVATSDVLSTLAEIGVILLLLEVGMEMDLRELRSVGKAAMSVAVVGVILPMGGGYFANVALGFDRNAALFVAAALTATSVGITARVFGDLRALATREARTVLGAAVADDVIGLIVLTVVVRIVTGSGSVSAASVGGIVALAVGFLVICTTIGVFGAPRLFAWIERRARSSSTLLVLALAFTLGVAQLATLAKLAPIIGAFVAGLSLGRTESAARIQRDLTPVGHMFIPVFFLQIGINVDIGQFVEPRVLWIAAVITVVAIVGKVIAGWAVVGSSSDRLLIGLGMIPRGEVGLIFAAIGLREGILDNELYAAVLLMVLVTTLVTPPALSWRVSRVRKANAESDDSLSVDDDLLLHWALRAAIDAAHTVPSPELLDRLASHDESSLSWGATERALFDELLLFGTARSWRLLDSTRILDRALPEVAPFLERRRRDSSILDPAAVHRFETLDRVRSAALDPESDPNIRAAYLSLEHPRRVVLASWFIDLIGSDEDAFRTCRAAVERVSGDASDVEAIGFLIDEQELLRATAIRPGGLSEENVLRVAVHLREHERASALSVISFAINALEPWERALVEEFSEQVSAALDSPLVSGSAATLIDRKRAEAILLLRPGTPAIDRVAIAPLSYVLGESPAAIAQQVALLDPLPAKNTFVVSMTHEDPDTTRIVIATRDRVGLLAHTTAVLETVGADLGYAMIATWGDGGALQVFRAKRLDLAETELESAAAKFGRQLAETSFSSGVLAPIPDAVLSFDNSASPWHTICEVRATDRVGLLHSLAAAVAVAGADVHAARITTTDEMAFDVFDLTDRNGRKLNLELQRVLRETLLQGSTSTAGRGRPGSRGFRRTRRPVANELGTRSKHS